MNTYDNQYENMNTYDAQYDCMRDYLLRIGFMELRPYVFEETPELLRAVLEAPEYAKNGVGTWGKERRECDVKVRLTKREKDDLITFCEASGLTQSEVVRQALKAYYHSQA